MNTIHRVALFSDLFGYTPQAKFPPFRTFFGSLQTIILLFFTTIYIIGSINCACSC